MNCAPANKCDSGGFGIEHRASAEQHLIPKPIGNRLEHAVGFWNGERYLDAIDAAGQEGPGDIGQQIARWAQ